MVPCLLWISSSHHIGELCWTSATLSTICHDKSCVLWLRPIASWFSKMVLAVHFFWEWFVRLNCLFRKKYPCSMFHKIQHRLLTLWSAVVGFLDKWLKYVGLAVGFDMFDVPNQRNRLIVGSVIACVTTIFLVAITAWILYILLIDGYLYSICYSFQVFYLYLITAWRVPLPELNLQFCLRKVSQ